MRVRIDIIGNQGYTLIASVAVDQAEIWSMSTALDGIYSTSRQERTRRMPSSELESKPPSPQEPDLVGIYVFEDQKTQTIRYTQTAGMQMCRSMYIEIYALRQVFGHLPKRIKVTVEEI